MRCVKLARLRAAVLLAAAILLSGCAPSVVPPRNVDVQADPLAGAVIDPDSGYRRAAGTTCSEEEVAHAAAALVAAGVLTQAELETLELDEPVSRAVWVRLIVGAFGVQLPVREQYETWYAPYVKAGYDLGLFADSTVDMSFTPTDGFRRGDRGYAEMEQPITRYDAAAVLAHASVPAEETGLLELPDLDPELSALLQAEVRQVVDAALLPPLEDGGFHGDSYISVGQALVCACKTMERGRMHAPQQTGSIPSVEDILKQQRRVVHAGGQIARENGRVLTYTNSAEALVNAYRAGNRILEFDFLQTADGHLACIHNWRSSYAPQITDDVPLTLAQWVQVDLFGEFTPLCLESLADFMRQHPDFYVVTDVKDDNAVAARVIADTCPDLKDRFVIQIYDDWEYNAVRQAGMPNIIYTLYNLSRAKRTDTNHWVEFAGQHALVGYAYPVKMEGLEAYTAEMKKAGIPLLVHTVDEAEKIAECYEAGITAVYTDLVS